MLAGAHMPGRASTTTSRVLGSTMSHVLGSTIGRPRSLHRALSTRATNAAAISEAGKAKNLKFFQFSFVDLFGVQRSKLVPASRVAEIAEAGAGFAGFAAHLDMDPTQGDLLAVPDPDTLTVLPWQPEVGWLSCNLVHNDSELGHGPRNVLRAVQEKIAAHGLQLRTGVECEFFLLDGAAAANGLTTLCDPLDVQAKPCYDAHALMRQYDLISTIVEYMETLGWGPYQADHEDASGQFEINWDYDDALKTADRVVFFKYMARTLAEKAGCAPRATSTKPRPNKMRSASASASPPPLTSSHLAPSPPMLLRAVRCTFMPKPFANLTGSGSHAHMSLWDTATGECVSGGGEVAMHKLSGTSLSFLAGMLEHAPALLAITNPTVNSYKRLNARGTTSGATWSPTAATWAGNNRSALVRVPGGATRMELRVADMAANPYLMAAAVGASGLDGLKKGSRPPPPCDRNMYDMSDPIVAEAVRAAPPLPTDLPAALDNLDRSSAMRTGLGDELVDSYLKLRRAHYLDYTSQLTAWEMQAYLDV